LELKYIIIFTIVTVHSMFRMAL